MTAAGKKVWSGVTVPFAAGQPRPAMSPHTVALPIFNLAAVPAGATNVASNLARNMAGNGTN